MSSRGPDDELLESKRVLLIDACSMLDVIRMPIRPKWVADGRSVEAILRKAACPAEFTLSSPEPIAAEYSRKHEDIWRDCQDRLRQRHNDLASTATEVIDLSRRSGIAMSSLPSINLPKNWAEVVAEHSFDLAKKVRSLLIVTQPGERVVSLAYARVAMFRAPAERGAPSMNDSVLCEAALELAMRRPPSTTGLLTSNEADFRSSGALRVDLQNDYDAAGLVDLPTWHEAAKFAGLP